MNQPTREEFDAFKQEIRQEVRQLREQRQTEEIPAINVNVASKDVLDQLQAINEKLDQQSTLLKRIDEKQDEHAKGLAMHSRQISTLQTNMATKTDIEKRFDAIAEVQKLILDRLPPQGE